MTVTALPRASACSRSSIRLHEGGRDDLTQRYQRVDARSMRAVIVVVVAGLLGWGSAPPPRSAPSAAPAAEPGPAAPAAKPAAAGKPGPSTREMLAAIDRFLAAPLDATLQDTDQM